MSIIKPRSVAEARLLVVRESYDQLGALYRDSSVPTNWPPQQFDCSVYTRWLWTMVGLDPDEGGLYSGPWPQPEPHPWHKYTGYTMDQVRALKNAGAQIDPDDIKPSDLSYYSNGDSHHVTVYVGNGKVNHAAGTAYGVIHSNWVGPGETGHGGKHLIGVFSPALLLGRLANLPPTIGQPKPPVTPKPPTPGKLPAISLSDMQRAARTDKNRPQGKGQYPLQTRIVETALVEAGMLAPNAYSRDGYWGTVTVAAYAKWQKALGYSGSDADGIPGLSSLTRLGQRTKNFRVVK